MANCPQKNDKNYKHLEELFGEGRALAIWKLAGETIPDAKSGIQLLYPNVHPVSELVTMDFGNWAGKYEPDYEKRIDDYILNKPDEPVNGAESFNKFQDRALELFSKLLDTAPDNTVMVTHSSLLKLFNLWNDEGRPNNLRVNNKAYTEAQTHTGDVEQFKSKSGTLYVVRHGQTQDNLKGNLRSNDTQLTDKGINDANKAAKELSKVPISELYTSPLDRTLHTTDIIMSKQETPVQDINYQLDNKTKQLKDGTADAIKRGKESEDSIGRAYRILEGTDLKTTERGRGMVQDSRIKDKIQRGNRSYSQKDPRGELDLISEGMEHEVYDKGDKVIKVNKVSSDRLTEYLEKLMVHNHLFPDTSYKLLGFIDREGEMLPVVEQDRIRGNEPFDMKKIGMYLFNKYEMHQVDPNIPELFVNDKVGIIIDDINPMNVIMKNGKPYFIDPQIIINKDKLLSSDNNNYQKSKSTIKQKPNTQLDNKVKGFLKSIGVPVQEIANRGQSFAAMADTVNGVISVVEGKSGIDTLSHEATHMFLDLLPEGSRLLHDIVTDVRKREEYEQIYEQYKDDPQYQNDGKVDEQKIAKETAAHIIDDIIVDKFQDRKAMKWWERLWKWMKELFTGKSLDSYQQVAEDILDNDISKLSRSKMQKMREANERGEIYYEKDKSSIDYIERLKKGPEFCR